MTQELTIDDKIEGLLEAITALAETQQQQSETVQHLISLNNTVKSDIESLVKAFKDKEQSINKEINQDTKQLISYLEQLAQRVVTENALTKTEVSNAISQVAKEQFIEHLSANLSNEIKASIQEKTADVAHDMIKPLNSEIANLKNEMQGIRQSLIDTSNDTKRIADNINQELKNGANEIVGNGVAQILDGIEQATASYQATVSNLQNIATKAESKTAPLQNFLDNFLDKFNHFMKFRAMGFSVAFCFVWCLFTTILYIVMVPSFDEISDRKKQLANLSVQLNKVENDIRQANNTLSAKQVKYINGKLHIRIDKWDCEDGYCRVKTPQEK